MELTRIIEELYDFNPWWKGTLPSEGNLYHRRQFEALVRLISAQQIIALTGLRRTGKTTLLLQIINHLIQKETIPSVRICRYQFEEKIIVPKDDDLERIIRAFIINTLKEDIHTDKRVFFFFDEIQFVEGWQAILKKYYDLNRNIKFFISGSSSLFIRKITRESLAGRTFEEKIAPLSFGEYINIGNYTQIDPPPTEFSFDLLSPGNYIDANRVYHARYNSIAGAYFDKFIVSGQFPEIIKMNDVQLAFRYIKNSIVAKIIEYDLSKLYGFRKTSELGLLINVLAKETANLMEFGNLASEIGVALNTLKEYIEAFQNSYLVSILYNYTKKHRESARQLKKSYIASPNISCAMLGLREENLVNNPFIGHLVETEIFNRLCEKYPNIAFSNERGKEVDFIIPFKERLIPVEVKYKDSLKKRDFSSLLDFMSKKDAPFGVIITKNTLDTTKSSDKPVYLIPAWMT
jgi:hypothetical protein